jgi:hypothetical protein
MSKNSDRLMEISEDDAFYPVEVFALCLCGVAVSMLRRLLLHSDEEGDAK